MDFLTNISPISCSLLVVLLPFLAFLYQAIVGRKARSGNVSLVAISLSAILSIYLFWNQSPIESNIEWFRIGDKRFFLGILLNNTTLLMQALVSIVALPVHIYSKAYMKGDSGIHRYWMYLSLFCFAMLGLVVSSNLLQLYIFWELVGFASYLLIGFWFTKESAAQANKKAFIINRIGDLGFLIGLAIVYAQFGTFNIVELFAVNGLAENWFSQVNSLSGTWLTVAGCAFFLGAMAKSAQFPLHVWLPDAMEGPTSVSSLIHAATMVAAGVFLLATVFPLLNETVLLIIAIIGTTTALLAAFFALTQNDIKKILAFSTISQLGFMVVGIGIGAWDAALFHLTTHAFFKCLLFLAAGAVIHEMAHFKHETNLDFDPQDINFMGGLKNYMPKTALLMGIASLALAGFPLTSGFLSKDALVISTFEWAVAKGGLYYAFPIILIAVSLMTSFYIGRLILKTFFGDFAFAKNLKAAKIHEASKTMIYPMAFLALFCLFIVFSWNPISYHLSWVLKEFNLTYTFEEIHSLHILIPVILTVGSLLMWWIGYQLYIQKKQQVKQNALFRFSFNQGYLNEFYAKTIIKPTLLLANFSYWFDRTIIDGLVDLLSKITVALSNLFAWVDKYIVDGIVNAFGSIAYGTGNLLRWVQNGRLQSYLGFAFTMVLLGLIYLIVI
ncbi:NADH-quinone oxidoreductase subunit L [Sphingobacterium hungaricum]|uniref:NADH-quinone oxidoreductase subunit L n=1 Tax=Sphingobacterium hungaricum TaxID=2082723 RepID=A0A928YQK2_9SPHI|nr:NADH-quinone oxidoreductase subunit L [Sphingobacterium hungaricum]MBE8713667.1 NADH-quinone oxidoreductase subunit L [Sphingobacterium hungaricum]